MSYPYPPATLAGLLPQEGRVEIDAAATIAANSILAKLLTSNAGVPVPPIPPLEPRIYFGGAPQPSSNFAAPRPYIVIFRTDIDLETGAGQAGGASIESLRPLISITCLSTHYWEMLDMGKLVRDDLINSRTAQVQQWEFVGQSYAYDYMNDGSMDPAHSTTLRFRAYQRTC
jgi:hypothetical protein